jgi:hypothetical protein
VTGRRAQPHPRVVRLSPGREARRRLAMDAAWDARDGDPALYRQRLEELVDLHFRLVAEQRAEEGYLPTTVEGCIAVLSVAERILRVVGGRDAPWSGTDERRQR